MTELCPRGFPCNGHVSELPAHCAASNKICECAEILPCMLNAASHKRRMNAVGMGIVNDFCGGK